MKPDRLLSEDHATPGELREALRAARARAPGEDDLVRIATSLGFGLPPSAPLPAPETSATGSLASGAKAGLVMKGAAAVGAAVLITAGVLRVRPTAPTMNQARPVASAPATIGSAHPSQELRDSVARAVASDSAPSAPALPAPQARTTRAARPQAPSAHLAIPDAPAASSAAQELPARPDTASRLREEALLVRNAQALLSSDPEGALRLVAERRRRFPGGVLGQEASVVAIEALLRLGRRRDAEVQAQAFEAAHPGSVHARRVRKLLEVQ